MSDTVQAEYCRSCRRETRWSVSGSQNGSRPLVRYWRCASCSNERVQLGKGKGSIADVARLAEMVVNERRRGATADVETAKLDFEDAEGHVREAIYSNYVSWDPARNASLISFVTWKARCALTDWFRDELGQFTPKAHAWAYSIDALDDQDSLDENYDEHVDSNSITGGESRSVSVKAGLADASIGHAITLVETEETTRTLRDIVFPLALGLSHAEVGALHGQSEAWVGARLRALRKRDDLRVPA